MNKQSNIYDDAVLIRKKLTGSISKEEEIILQERFNESPSLRDIYRKWENASMQDIFSSDKSQEATEDAFRKFIFTVADNNIRKKKHRTHRLWRYTTAATVIMGILLFSYMKKENNLPSVAENKGLYDGHPDMHNQDLQHRDQPQFQYTKTDFNSHKVTSLNEWQWGIIYDFDPQNQQEIAVMENASLVPFEIQVLEEGEKSIILSDETKVYLTKGSKLSYPVRFSDENRKVELEGEATFEISEDDERPFIIVTARREIRVEDSPFHINSKEVDKE